jgi:hypothetical protein
MGVLASWQLLVKNYSHKNVQNLSVAKQKRRKLRLFCV